MGIIAEHEQMRERTKQFAYRVIRLYRTLPKTTEAFVIGKQLLRCGTSVAANYRAAGRSRSKADFASKIAIVFEEADESVFWLECLRDHNIVREQLLQDLIAEADQLVRIFSASYHTARN
jgi:four helix bundle protein